MKNQSPNYISPQTETIEIISESAVLASSSGLYVDVYDWEYGEVEEGIAH